MTLIEYFICFGIFVILESLAINGIHWAFEGGCTNDIKKGRSCTGNIFYLIAPEFFEKNKGKKWTLPLWGCVRCQSSVCGGIIFWGTVLPIFGFSLIEIWIFVLNTFILVSLNWIIYKKL
jgi:hypothetical protein